MPRTSSDGSESASQSAPPPLVTAASLVIVEAVLLLGLGVLEIASLDSRRLTMGFSTAAFFIAAAVGLVASAWALKNLNRWGRGPVLLAQLISLGLAWNLWAGQTKPFSAILAVLAILVIAGVVHPASMAALDDLADLDDRDEDH